MYRQLEDNIKAFNHDDNDYAVWTIRHDNTCEGTVWWCSDMWGKFTAKFDENLNITDYKVID